MPITVHFRDALDLYPDPHCHLVVVQPDEEDESPPISRFRPIGVTSYGAVFRLDLKTPFSFRVANSSTLHIADGSEDHIILADPDTIISDADITSIDSFLLVMFNYYHDAQNNNTTTTPWLVASDDTLSVRREFFPRFRIPSIRNRAVVFLDKNMFNSRRHINLSICTNEDQLLADGSTRLETHAAWAIDSSSNLLHVHVYENDRTAVSFHDCRPNELLDLIRAEAKHIEGLSQIILLISPPDTSLKTNAAADASVSAVDLSLTSDMCYPYYPSRLRLYFLNFDHTSSLYSFQVQSMRDPSKQWTVRREKDLVRECSVFFVDLSYQPRDLLIYGFSFTPVHVVTKIPCREPLVWKPDLGYNVAIVQSYAGLQMIQDLEHTVIYHRFGDEFQHWGDLLLKIWSDHDGSAREFTVNGQPQISSHGSLNQTILFDCAGIIFPKGAKVYMQPVKTESIGRDGVEKRVSCKDVVRKWTAGDVEGGDIHIVQGDTQIRSILEMDQGIEPDRFVKVRYRRYEDDYLGWNLRAWEDFHGIRTSVTLQKVDDDPGEGILFLLDRGKFGAGTDITLLPQLHGEIHEEDKPVRCWKSGEHPSDLFIVQGTANILTQIEDARKTLRAQVNRDGEVEVSAAAPFLWFADVQASNGSNVPAVSLELVLTSKNKTQTNKTNIQVRQQRLVSPVKCVVVLSESDLLLNEDFPIEHIHLGVSGFEKTRLMWKQFSDPDAYYYSGNLGIEYTPERSSFKCFAPQAASVSVVLYDEATGNSGRRCVKMRRIPEGCWKTVIKKDLKNMYYKLLATGPDKLLFPGVEVIDPYSRCNTGHTGRSFIYGTENTPIAPRPNIPVENTIVYELHIRDATIDEESGVNRKGKFLGLTERGTRMKSLVDDNNQYEYPHDDGGMTKSSTGLDHIIEMGVTAVQIMPIQDFDNNELSQEEYRWGYMPVHFNSPDGWYASSVTDASRITEFKQLVDAFHKHNIKVIMDVVYNHTAEDSNERNLEARFSFNGLAPRYYYRTCGNTPVASNGDRTCGKLSNPEMPNCGSCYSNGSGCGNEFRSESPMGRKFIIDSLKYWVNEYGVDGFRFDLLGLMDVETMKQATKALHEIDPNIVVYGEPWCGGLTPIDILDKGKQRSNGFGVFNNTLRDAIRGSPFGLEETFVMDGGRISDVKKGIIGSIDIFTDNAMETINYVECHDNYTLWDHMEFYIKERYDDITFTNEDIRRMNALAAVIVFTSQGIPFIQMGQEMCRTKFGEENSYESPDEINKIRWENKAKYWRNVKYYGGLIALRKAFPHIWALKTPPLIREAVTFYEDIPLAVPDRCVAFLVANSGDEMVVCLNPTPTDLKFPLPGGATDTLWIQLVDDRYAGIVKIAGPFVASVMVRGRGAAVLRKATAEENRKEQVHMRLACITGAYTSAFGDDTLGEYAVSLRTNRSKREMEEHKRLETSRKQFLGTAA